MTDAPERIVARHYSNGIINARCALEGFSFNGGNHTAEAEYIRADLVPTWQPMETAPRDGTPVLVKIKDDLSPWGIKPGGFGETYMFAGLFAVMSDRGNGMGWGFAAPVGRGGFSDAWLDGWMPLPTPPKGGK